MSPKLHKTDEKPITFYNCITNEISKKTFHCSFLITSPPITSLPITSMG